MPRTSRPSFWRYVRGLAPPVITLLLLVLGLGYALFSQATLWERSDEDNVREWVQEARVFGGKSLPELIRERVRLDDVEVPSKDEEIYEELKALGTPTKTYPGQFPLFPVIYRLEVHFMPSVDGNRPVIAWDSHLPRPERPDTPREGRVRRLDPPVVVQLEGEPVATLHVDYHLHAFNRRQRDEAARQDMIPWLAGLGLAAIALALTYVYFFLRRERERELQKLLAQQQVEHERAEKLLIENERNEIERKLLRQEVETQRAEQKALEVKSQLFASIGIMAGSYAHNIKNLLVRPNDLLRRCMDQNGLMPQQRQMLMEVGETLGTVTERLQQILKTVRRDPTKSELEPIELNEFATEVARAWQEMADQKWRLSLKLELASQATWIVGDHSHLVQAVENLLFNARDATFEMRAHVRAAVRHDRSLSEEERRQALIDAASWRGQVILRTRIDNDQAMLEVVDNGIGMSEEVRQRCTETHFSTKRDNALHEGNSVGMGLGLSFVLAILEHHEARLSIISMPLHGSTFQLSFPLKPALARQSPSASSR